MVIFVSLCSLVQSVSKGPRGTWDAWRRDKKPCEFVIGDRLVVEFFFFLVNDPYRFTSSFQGLLFSKRMNGGSVRDEVYGLLGRLSRRKTLRAKEARRRFVKGFEFDALDR